MNEKRSQLMRWVSEDGISCLWIVGPIASGLLMSYVIGSDLRAHSLQVEGTAIKHHNSLAFR